MTEVSGDSTDKPRRPVVVPATGLVALTAIGITALLGGLNEVPEQPDPLAEGAVLDQGLYETKFVESRVTVEKAESDFEEDKRFVELLFDVTNKGDETLPVGLPPEKPSAASISFAGSLIKITPVFGKDAGPFVFAQAKGGETRQLHPGTTSRVVIRWRLQDTQQPPEKVTMDVASFEEGTGFISGAPQWEMVSTERENKIIPEIKARVTFTVKKGDAA